MDTVASRTPRFRRDLFNETASRMGVDARVVEKDFWVCWTLGHLFSLPGYGDHFLFKGGTSLSKIFHVIKRFSEDVDIAVNWEPLGFTGDRDPTAEMSKNRRSKILGQMLAACRTFIHGELRAALTQRWENILDQEWHLEVEQATPDALRFRYPKALSLGSSYLDDAVVLELGTHAEWIPHGSYEVTPYAAEEFPEQFEDPMSAVRAIKAERTFWEKATILHAEYHRPQEKRAPLRHARHYYDTVMLGRNEYGERALADTDLLSRVVEHKRRFYPATWARYDLAVPGSLRLVPAESRQSELARDYAAMDIMFFGPRPSFEELLGELKHLEQRINPA
jgi:hypothetical protein